MIHISTAAAGTNRITSLRANVPSPVATPISTAPRIDGWSAHTSIAHIASEISRQLTLSDITKPSLIHRFGYTAAIAAAINPTRSPADPSADETDDRDGCNAARHGDHSLAVERAGPPADGGHQRGSQRAVLGSGLIDEDFSEPHAMSQLLRLGAVVQRVVQQERMAPLGHDEADDSQRGSTGHDQSETTPEVSFTAGLAHNGRG